MRVLPLLALLAVAAAPAAKPEADAPQPLTLAAAPGQVKDAAKRLLLKPYADATGTALGDVAWDGAPHGADLVILDGPAVTAACRSGAVDKLDWSRLTRDRFAYAATSDCGAGIGIATTAMAWDRDRVQGTPNWADFWDVAKRPGRRGLQRTARGTLEIALMADGVSVGDVYRTLRNPEGVDRAFRKLDQLKPYLEWWDKPGQPTQSLASGKVLFTTAPAAGIAQADAAQHKHFTVQWGGSLSEPVVLAMAHGAPHPIAAQLAMTVAFDIARQAQFAQATGLGPGVRDAVGLLPADARAASPALPANLQAGLTIDEGFWADNHDKLESRFAAWLAK